MMVAGLIYSADCVSCPSFVTTKSLPGWVQESNAQDIRLVAYNPVANSSTSSQEIPLQVDPIQRDGSLDTKRNSQSNFSVAEFDRFVFDAKNFGAKAPSKEILICGGTNTVEIESRETTDSNKKFAYLVDCRGSKGLARTKFPQPVDHKTSELNISSTSFDYHYLPTNQLLFRSLKTKTERGDLLTASRNSDFLFHLDLKRFFTLSFTNKDVESYVEATRSGPLGISGHINFYLRLLMFKIDLKLATLASFYEDSANIPMIVDVPKSGTTTLNPGSGMFYSFKPDGIEIDLAASRHPFPEIRPEEIKAGAKSITSTGLKNCGPSVCTYDMQGRVESKYFSLQITVPRPAVEQGFFPILVTKVEDFKQKMNLKTTDTDEPGRVGFYYENSGLEKGRFTMDYWLTLTSSLQGGACPNPVSVKPMDAIAAAPASPAPDSSPSH
jgi:hypothetical protein